MSRLGKRPITIPSGVSIKVDNGYIEIVGPKGVLRVLKLDGVEITESGDTLLLQPSSQGKQARMNWGTMWSLIGNAIKGVTEGFEKVLEIEGVGFRVSLENNELVLKVGFSHLVHFPVPEGIVISVDKNRIIVSGINKELVGQTASNIRKIKKPEPYLGKGIKYQGEIIRRKAGKKAGSA